MGFWLLEAAPPGSNANVFLDLGNVGRARLWVDSHSDLLFEIGNLWFNLASLLEKCAFGESEAIAILRNCLFCDEGAPFSGR